ncbi:general stress protein [Citricoccus sp. NPDC079358]|uniref:general stress protein n=1 Tax=Citricoccus sp. NPDC079358 TaxID=3154653 RepID=UPI00344C9C92
MSMLFGPTSSDPSVSGLPRGEVLGSFPTYAEARKVVDRLAEQEFDVRTVSVVGTDLRTVERIRNRLTYPSVALRSALQGAFFGAMLGILMTLIDPAGSGLQILYTVGLGVAIWVLFGVIGHALRKGRGVNSVQQLVPSNFDVVCEFETSHQAKQLLGRPGPAPAPAPQTPAPPAHQAAPPQPPASQSSTSQSPANQTPVAEPAAHQGPTPDTPAADTAPVPSVPESEAPSRNGTFPDLPDGRPQYGVRLPEDEAKAVQERILSENAAKNAPGSQAAASFEAPSYGQQDQRNRQGQQDQQDQRNRQDQQTSGRRGRGGLGRRSDRSRPVDGAAAPTVEGDRPTSGAGSVPQAQNHDQNQDQNQDQNTAAAPGATEPGEHGTSESAGGFERPAYGRRAAVDQPEADQPDTPQDEPERRD